MPIKPIQAESVVSVRWDANRQDPLYVGDPELALFSDVHKALDFEGRSRQAIERFISATPLAAAAQDLLSALNAEPAWRTIGILKPMIHQREQLGEAYLEGWLNLGIAYATAGDYDQAIPALKQAVELVDDVASTAAERAAALEPETSVPDAHYRLGRALYESGRDPAGAVSELRKTVGLEPNNPKAQFFLGQSLRTLVERKTSIEAERAFQAYLDQGAPLGHVEEVQAYLESRILLRNKEQAEISEGEQNE